MICFLRWLLLINDFSYDLKERLSCINEILYFKISIDVFENPWKR